MEEGFTTHVAQMKNCIVIIKNVPCMKCKQCGETVLTGTVLKKIEVILSKCESVMTEVAIVNYNEAA
jgi:YgiT-type zinc finger domain-containing protein